MRNRRFRRLETRLRDEASRRGWLYASQAKRVVRRQADDDAVAAVVVVDDVEEEMLEEQTGVLRGGLAFEIIHSDDLWRHILEFV